METKKNAKANIEKMRFPIALTALLFAGSVVLASFSYTSNTEKVKNELSNVSATEIEFVQMPEDVKLPEPVEQNNVTLPPDDNIKIDSNNLKDPPDFTIILLPPPDIKTGDVKVKENKIIEYPDIEASFPGGIVAMKKWIAENVQYPQASIEMNEQGTVYLSFVVEKNGDITNIELERGVSGDIDREAKRVLRQMPHWIAGEAGGHKARTRCRLPINFTLH